VTSFWQAFEPAADAAPDVWTDHYLAPMPDGTRLRLPLRDLGAFAVAGLIANQASFAVLDRLAAWVADAARVFRPDIVVGLPTLGHAVGAATARALGHAHWVAPSTTRKLWYDDALSIPLGSITAPALGANASRRMWLDPRLMPRLRGRVLLVDDVLSTGASARAGLALLRAAGVEPVAVACAMAQGGRWREGWDAAVPVVHAFATPIFRRVPGGWRAEDERGDDVSASGTQTVPGADPIGRARA
jgi:adenine/guanine phosphoribosyltransferase-like PRPP-binding protein